MLDLNYLEGVMKLMDKYKIDTMSTPELSLTKKIHIGKPMPKPKKKTVSQSENYDDELLFYSTPAPILETRDLARYSVNKPADEVE